MDRKRLKDNGQRLSPERKTRISIVVPVYNEQDVLLEFHRRLSPVLTSTELSYEIIYVNDGSTDATLAVIQQMKRDDGRVALLDLSRNFGKEIALTAGLDYAGGEAVVVIDADLQDPPELIPELISGWRDGYDVVYATRTSREGETFFKKVTSRWFYRLIQKLCKFDVPADTGDFRLLSRRAVDAIRQLREQHRFMKGLFAWIGYPQTSIHYCRSPRFAGKTKWNYWRLWNFALEGVTSFTMAPLQIATYFGLAVAACAFAYGALIIIKTLLFGNPVPGYPSLMVVVLFLGGVQLVAVGIIGEYLGRMFDETKGRPLYLVNAYNPPTPDGRIHVDISRANVDAANQPDADISRVRKYS
ncbi:MAG TPA: glycosyltransferase family 2 protein [Burkholderiales bacterium]|nr:glycosyltransferase family 2 protein [Burkholderiales bacterium]